VKVQRSADNYRYSSQSNSIIENHRKNNMSLKASTLVALNREQSISETDSFTLERYAQFVSHFSSEVQDVLDVGCNTGRGGQVIKSHLKGSRIVGLDCVPDRLERLDRNIYQNAVCGFADKIDLPSSSFDAIVAGEIIEHIPGPSIFPSLYEFFRLLRLKGRLLLTTPNPHYLRNRLEGKSVLLDASHVSQHTIASMRRKLEDAGFSHIHIYGSGKTTRYLGQRFPALSVYGSYLAVALKW
jgi:2-polyprenyl-3-methyl-5-hydroxy-6-metoxy-1,4-benzoquinol methylase